ncbi:MAG TPA: PQQ-binding-like beta-propeller repeat protein, partial [Steroidobacteraceae bacterium]|nr:PQQ-binding-like beta-propeller repeat protein [Steroidobacteraceae bacterium]
TPHGTVAALDAETGTELWRTSLSIRRLANYSDPANRGPTFHRTRLYIGTIDGRLVCVNSRDGKRCEKFGSNGEIDLIAGLRSKPGYPGEYGVTSAPAVYRNLVIVGSSVGDNGRARMSSGEVRAFDAITGQLKWTFHPLSEKSPTGAANTWSKIVVDEERDLAFLPTGSPSPDYFGGLRPGNNEYANSVVALKASTGKPVWHFQTVHHDLWDYDVASPPLLFQRKSRGGSIPAVAVGSKTGHLFLFDRRNGKPLFPIEERPVPASDTKEEETSRTQPFPTKPASLAPQRITENDIWGLTPEDRAACLSIFRSLRNEGIFTPPSVTGALHVPGNAGGLHWGGIAWDAKNRLLIAPINRLPAIIRLIPREGFANARKEFPSRETTEQNGTPYGMSREFFRSPSGRPCTAPPWGELVAVRADDGEIAWRVPLGEMPAEVVGAPAAIAGSLNLGGPATSNGLVFIGASLDPYLRAFDAATGREVWKGALPTSARATPLVFTTKSGRQMVAIAAGGHDVPNVKLDTKLVVFALAQPEKHSTGKSPSR